jgi:hypothetical protein
LLGDTPAHNVYILRLSPKEWEENLGATDRRAVSKALVAVTLILVVAVAGGAGYYAVTLQQTQTSPSPSPSTTEPPLSSQTVTPTPNSSSIAPVVTISYTRWMGPLGTDLSMNISIRNQGYAGFDANATRLYVVLEGTKYKYSSGWTRTYGSWENMVVSNNGAYSGTLFFNVPKSGSLEAYTLYYEDNSNSYNIVYEPK